MALDEPKDSDKTFNFDSLNFLVDQSLLDSVGAITIDHIDDGFRSGLTITSEKPLASKPGGSACGGSCRC